MKRYMNQTSFNRFKMLNKKYVLKDFAPSWGLAEIFDVQLGPFWTKTADLLSVSFSQNSHHVAVKIAN